MEFTIVDDGMDFVINADNVGDYHYSYILWGKHDDPELKEILDAFGKDTNFENWDEYTTCYGHFIHYKHKITGEIL